jgi:hypothetical protein
MQKTEPELPVSWPGAFYSYKQKAPEEIAWPDNQAQPLIIKTFSWP